MMGIPPVIERRQHLLRRLKELDPPDIFLHNNSSERYTELDPDLPINPDCASCLDAEGWTEMAGRVEAAFQRVLSEP